MGGFDLVKRWFKFRQRLSVKVTPENVARTIFPRERKWKFQEKERRNE